MNTETGAIYEGPEAIAAAILRGEPIVRVSDRVAKTMRAGQRAQVKAAQKPGRRKRQGLARARNSFGLAPLER